MKRWVFLDRDGTLNRDTGFVHRVQDYERMPFATEALKRLAAAGFGLAIITNQGGIGRGLFTLEDFQRFQQHLLRDFAAEGVTIAASFYCPHAPGAGCDCRKPKPGMLYQAREQLGADLARCFVIGDRVSDAQAGLAAGLRGAVLLDGIEDEADAALPEGTVRAANLAEAADAILKGFEAGG